MRTFGAGRIPFARGGSRPVVTMESATRVSLLRWLRRQLRQPTPARERLEAAIEHGDAAEAQRLVARFEFSDAQRHHVERLLAQWEADLRRLAPADDLDPPGGA